MSLEYFCCFHDYLAKTRNLSDSELGRLFRALMTYSATGEKTQLNGREETAFDFISIDIDAAKERYNAKCAKLKANGETANATKCHQMPPKKKERYYPPYPPCGGARVCLPVLFPPHRRKSPPTVRSEETDVVLTKLSTAWYA